MLGIIDVGGGLRAIYGVGVFDRLMDEGACFDYCGGVSAGSANVISYIAGQRGRNYRFYTEYSMRKEYISLHNLLKNGSYINLQYAYGTLSRSDGEDPLDYAQIQKSSVLLNVVATNALTGQAVYFSKQDVAQDQYDIFMASSALPVFCKPYFIEGTPYYDGGISDPIPFEKAFADGCDRVAVILTRPIDYVRDGKRDQKLSRLIRQKYPHAAKALCDRYQIYNGQVAKLKKLHLEDPNRLLVIAPDDCCGVDTLTREKEHLDQLYQKGYQDAGNILKWL